MLTCELLVEETTLPPSSLSGKALRPVIRWQDVAETGAD
jgi:hypothetical protein